MASEILQNVQKWQKLGNGQKIMKKNKKVLDISPEINATILHTPACTQKWWTEAMGWSIGVRKMRKMCKNGKNWENGQILAKNNEKKKKKFSISHLKPMQLYFTHWLVPKNDEPRPWGGPLECTNAQMSKTPSDEFWPQCCFLAGGEWAFGQEAMSLWFLVD